jgi:hypothetical protein
MIEVDGSQGYDWATRRRVPSGFTEGALTIHVQTLPLMSRTPSACASPAILGLDQFELAIIQHLALLPGLTYNTGLPAVYADRLATTS